jgi:hypothetical protein
MVIAWHNDCPNCFSEASWFSSHENKGSKPNRPGGEPVDSSLLWYHPYAKKDPRSGQKISFLSALMGLPTLTSNFSMIAGAVVGGIPNPILISSCHISQKACRVSRDSAQSPTWSVEATERLQLI